MQFSLNALRAIAPAHLILIERQRAATAGISTGMARGEAMNSRPEDHHLSPACSVMLSRPQ
jgi:hypothetical protein